jgi:hypothetical protein
MDYVLLHVITRVLMMLVFAEAIADCFSTNLALTLPGVTEGNPIMAFVMRLVKDKWVLVRLAMALASIYGGIKQPDHIAALLYLANFALMAYVIWNNVSIILAKRKAAGSA